MAKGQIHMGKNGPEKCSADSSKARSRGCPYEATGHFSSENEALDSYATLNRVDPSELSALVKDGASPKDAVGLIRSGYGTDYLAAAKKDERVPDTTLVDESADYLDAKTQATLQLDSIAPGTTVSGSSNSEEATILIGRKAANPRDSFSYVLAERDGDIRLLSARGDSLESVAVGSRIFGPRSEDIELQGELKRMIGSYRRMTAEEASQGETDNG